MRNGKTRFLVVAGLMAAFLAAGSASATVVTSFDEAKRAASTSALPILIKFGSEKCGPCQEFDEAVAGDPLMQSVIDGSVVLCVLNGKEGEAGDVGKLYSVYKRPSFVLTSASGETMDRWSWYADVAKFQESLEKALVEPMTVSARFERFRGTPSEEDAVKIASIRHEESLFGEAITWYRRAQALNPASEVHYESEIFDCYAYGTMFHMYGPEDLTKQADAVFASEQSDEKDYMRVVYAMSKASSKLDDVAMYTPYLKAGYELTSNATDKKVLKMRQHVAADYALLVQEDEEKAIELRKAAQPENWMESPNDLNNFAWWCFEKSINLDEAADLARKGIQLAEPGTQKGNIYDTLAEICNLTGDCGKAVDLIKLAVAEDPENDYFQKQLVRFEEILVAQK